MRLLWQIEDMNSQAQLSNAQQLAQGGGAGAVSSLQNNTTTGGDDNDDDIPELEPVDDAPADVDETGVDPKDVELVMQQVGCTRAKAVKALKESNGDLINASTSPVSCVFCMSDAEGCYSSYGRQRVVSPFWSITMYAALQNKTQCFLSRLRLGVTTLSP